MEIKSNKRNETFRRQELVVETESEKNPGYAEVKKLIAKEIKKPEENVDILNVNGKFGRNVFVTRAYVYDSKDDLEKMSVLRLSKKQKKEIAEAKMKASPTSSEVETEKDAEIGNNSETEEKEEVEEKE